MHVYNASTRPAADFRRVGQGRDYNLRLDHTQASPGAWVAEGTSAAN